jgi:hypothetical protein
VIGLAVFVRVSVATGVCMIVESGSGVSDGVTVFTMSSVLGKGEPLGGISVSESVELQATSVSIKIR